MTTKPSETNYVIPDDTIVTPENIIAALKQANRKRGETIDNFAESNARLRARIAKLTKIIAMMKADIVETRQKLQEVVERHTL